MNTTKQTEGVSLTALSAAQLRLLADLKDLVEKLQSPLREIVSGIFQPAANGAKPKRKWTAAHRRNFLRTMRENRLMRERMGKK